MPFINSTTRTYVFQRSFKDLICEFISCSCISKIFLPIFITLFVFIKKYRPDLFKKPWKFEKILLTCFKGPSKIWSMSSFPVRVRRDGKSPMYFKMAWKMEQDSSLNSSLFINFFNRGNLMGSRECLQSSSPRPRLAEAKVRLLDTVLCKIVIINWYFVLRNCFDLNYEKIVLLMQIPSLWFPRSLEQFNRTESF